MRFSIDQKNLEAILNYLASKPYAEVVGLIGDIQRDITKIEEELTGNGN